MMIRYRLAAWLLGLSLTAISTSPVSAAEAPAVAENGQERPAAKKETKPARQYVRVRRDDSNEPIAMDTAIVRFVPADKSSPRVVVDLIGAVHIGDKSYYDELNKRFGKYDVLLYELVAPEEARVPPAGARAGGGHPVGAMQSGMKSMLELEHQIERIDYTKDNFVHADMSPDEFAKTMKDRGESFMQMFFRLMGQGIAEQSRDPQRSTDRQLLMAMFAKDRPLRLKRIMAQQFEDLEGQTAIFDGPDGSTIITERNRKAFDVLREQLDEGKRRIGVFYGAGHLSDMEDRLIRDFGMKRQRLDWLEAWSLVPPAAREAK